MEWYKILALCLSSFALGISFTGLVFSTLEYRRATQRLARMDARRAELEIKEKELLKGNPHQPLTRYDWETSEEFAKRVQDKLAQGELTMNAARVSLGLPHLPAEPGCHTCKHKVNPRKGEPCVSCEDQNGIPDKWEEAL